MQADTIKPGSLEDCCPKDICRGVVFCKNDPCKVPGTRFDRNTCTCLGGCEYAGSYSGGDEGLSEIVYYEVGQGAMLLVSYQTYFAKDDIRIFGGASFNSGCVGEQNTVSLPLKSGSSSFGIAVAACDSNTAWEIDYRIVCSNDE